MDSARSWFKVSHLRYTQALYEQYLILVMQVSFAISRFLIANTLICKLSRICHIYDRLFCPTHPPAEICMYTSSLPGSCLNLRYPLSLLLTADLINTSSLPCSCLVLRSLLLTADLITCACVYHETPSSPQQTGQIIKWPNHYNRPGWVL